MDVAWQAVAMGALLFLAGSGCSAIGKVDARRPFSRDGWQHPAAVLAAIPVWPGARVADVGAGNGYFAWKLADAVGDDGRVFAVEVDDGLTSKLERGVAERALGNVAVVRGELDDPQLPDSAIDVVLLSSVYHHLDDRVAYMRRLRRDLAPGARVAIVEPRAGWESWLLLLPPGHGVDVAVVRDEMRAAGYRAVASHDFLPAHSFEVFAAE
jgi:arsenite methyltransferase